MSFMAALEDVLPFILINQDPLHNIRLGMMIADVAGRLDSKLQAMSRKWAAELLGIEELPRFAVDKQALRMDRKRLDETFADRNKWGEKRRPGHINVAWVSEAQEDLLRDVGFDFPTRAEGTGKITYKGKEVGHASNFSGLMFDYRAKEAVWKHRKVFERIGFWYTN